MSPVPAEPLGSDPAAAETSATGHPASGLQAVLFDMDGLLVDSEPLWFEVECQVMARLGGQWSEADQAALVGGSLQRTLGYLLARAATPASAADVTRWLTEGMTGMLAARGLSMLPGARELVAEVRAAGVPHALVTSSERPIMDAVLRAIGGEFCVTVCAADVSRGKPDPEPYLRAAALLGADPRCSVALEDSPNGIASAEAAGCAVVAVPSLMPIQPRPGRLVVGSLREVDLALLRSLVCAARPATAPSGRPGG
jgi:HAD superfamily hydrolase (TIGR01509 family)